MTFTGSNFNYGSQYSGGDGSTYTLTKEKRDENKRKRLEQVQVVSEDQYDRNDLRQEMKGQDLQLGMNPLASDQKRYNLSPNSMWDGKTFLSPEDYGAKFQRSLDPKTGLPLKGAHAVQNVKNTVIDAASAVNQKLNTAVDALPEELDPAFELLNQLSTQSAETIFSVLGSGWDSLPKGVRKNVTSGGATVLQAMDNGIVGLAQATGFDPAIVDLGLGLVEGGFGAIRSKGGQQLLKEGAEFFSRKGPPTAGGLIPIPNVGIYDPNANILNGGSLLEKGNVMAIKGSSSSAKISKAARNKLSDFIENETKTLKTKTINFKGVDVDVPLFPGTKEELLEKVQAYIRFNEAAGSQQPRKGWQKLFGTFIGEDGLPLDLEGGRANTGRPLRFRTTKGQLNRNFGEQATPTGYIYNLNGIEVPIPKERPKPQLFNRVGQLLKKAGFHKHHVTHIKTTEPFGLLPDGSLRPLEQRQRVTARLAKEEGIFFGNQDYNEIYLSIPGHLGKKGDDSSLAVHRTLEAMTDIQGFGDWRSQASELFVSGGAYGKGTWIENVKNLPAGTVIEKYKMKTKSGFTMPGTYIKGQKHGFSEELIQKISKLKTDDEIISAVKTFYNKSGMVDTMQGAAAIAQYAVDGGVTGDLLTTQFWKTKKPQMIDFAKVLLQDDAYKNNKILKKIASGKF
jgi:hypothetical protein